jgi:hypothetical protein
MNPRYRSYRRNAGMFYVLDSQTGKRESLKTTDPQESSIDQPDSPHQPPASS